MEGFLLLAGTGLVVWALFWLADVAHRAGQYTALKPRLDKLDQFARELDQRALGLDSVSASLDEMEKAILLLSKQKAVGFPWLAEAYAEFYALEALRAAEALERKKHPAKKAADQVREFASHRRAAQREARVLRYQLAFYESLFPWLAELRSEEIDEELIRVRERDSEADDNAEDPAARWLTPEEFARLPSAEKFQLALERYWTKKKSNWEIGRDYERYIGYLYERKGFRVSYHGIVEGFDDLGRDLICDDGARVFIVQCKCWSVHKTIHEKHIFQLYGTVIAYRVDHPSAKVAAHFVTSTVLSDRARLFADVLGIKVEEKRPLTRYPSIKCNIARKGATKIFHLPFDQQYDRTVVETDRGERYVETVAEAERLGFRRAFRYRGGRDAQP